MKIYKSLVILFFTTIAFCKAFSQKQIFYEGTTKVWCVYNTYKGRVTGEYVSYHSNGKIMSKGTLVNGYKTGLWCVWDSIGRKRIERNYKNPFEFIRIIPSIPQRGPIPLLAENTYKMKYNSEGFIEYANIKSEDAIWRHKNWRIIDPTNNENLFDNKGLFTTIQKLALDGKIQLFDTIDDRFTTVINKEKVKDYFNVKTVEVIGYLIKEESIFDLNRQVSEYRIIGICPMVKVNDESFSRNWFWVYYPDIRKYLAKEIVTSKDKRIKTLDDLFIFRDFESRITKTTIDNPYDLPFVKYPKITSNDQIRTLAEETEIVIIEADNKLLLSLTK
jgi:hypothetical protein